MFKVKHRRIDANSQVVKHIPMNYTDGFSANLFRCQSVNRLSISSVKLRTVCYWELSQVEHLSGLTSGEMQVGTWNLDPGGGRSQRKNGNATTMSTIANER